MSKLTPAQAFEHIKALWPDARRLDRDASGWIASGLDDLTINGSNSTTVEWGNTEQHPMIDEPKPDEYRAFASYAEFTPHAEKWIVFKGTPDERLRVIVYSDTGVWFGTGEVGRKYDRLLSDYEFSDGTPCGVPVE